MPAPPRQQKRRSALSSVGLRTRGSLLGPTKSAFPKRILVLTEGAMSRVVAVVGATGAVGREMLRTLERRAFPTKRVVALASKRSPGQKLPFRGGELTVEELTPAS